MRSGEKDSESEEWKAGNETKRNKTQRARGRERGIILIRIWSGEQGTRLREQEEESRFWS